MGLEVKREIERLELMNLKRCRGILSVRCLGIKRERERERDGKREFGWGMRESEREREREIGGYGF